LDFPPLNSGTFDLFLVQITQLLVNQDKDEMQNQQANKPARDALADFRRLMADFAFERRILISGVN
jgi:hypothetical protein